VENRTLDKQARELTALVVDLFEVEAYYQQQDRVVLSLRPRYQPRRSLTLLKDRLELSGYDFDLNPSDDTLLLTVNPKRKFHIPKLNIILFFLTLATVYFLPVFYFNLNAPSWGAAFDATLADLARGRGLEFTAALMSILLVHEMGHFVASRRRGIVTSWPYFIPAPNFIGTFGAVIRSKSPFWNRRDLIEVGAAGPIAGWIVALVWLIYGLSQSSIIPADLALISGMTFTLDGKSILVRSLVPVLIAPPTPDHSYLFTEAAFAGWVGLLVTAINMLPIGQLDGGHILYGMFRQRQATLAWLALGILLILGFQSRMWWLFAALGFIMGVTHPPTLDDSKPPSRASQLMGWAALLIFLISFTPVPFR
jgi:Zn-dependent protease